VLHDQVLPLAKEFCYVGVVFIIGSSLDIDITARSRKFIGSVASVLRGQVAGADEVYVHVIKTKCMCFMV
jgi:hypothetical protein